VPVLSARRKKLFARLEGGLMKRAQVLLVSVLLAVTSLGALAPSVTAYDASAWTYSDSFTTRCLGFSDSYPGQLNSLARAQLAALGYSPIGGAIGPSFTRTAFLNGVLPDWGVYVHSHGDNYWAASGRPNIDSAFLQDPGSTACSSFSRDVVRSSAIKAVTWTSPYNLIVMSTCYLGSSSSTMPGAFSIEKVKNSTDNEFYLGYVYSTYDSAMLRFEKAFWSYLSGGARTVSQAFTYASGIGGYSSPDAADPFQANWWGNPNYNGRHG
jgi:hypothetical protein